MNSPNEFPDEGVGPLRDFVQRLEAIGYAGCYSEIRNPWTSHLHLI